MPKKKKNPTHLTRAARALAAKTDLTYAQALVRLRDAKSLPNVEDPAELATFLNDPSPAPAALPAPASRRFRARYELRSGIDPTARPYRTGDQVVVSASDEDAAVVAAITFIDAEDPYCDPRVEPIIDVIDIEEVCPRCDQAEDAHPDIEDGHRFLTGAEPPAGPFPTAADLDPDHRCEDCELPLWRVGEGDIVHVEVNADGIVVALTLVCDPEQASGTGGTTCAQSAGPSTTPPARSTRAARAA